jgi:hypothetical protein
MTNTHTSLTHRAGALLLVGATLTVAAAIAIGIATANSHVAHDVFRFPLSQHTFVAFSVYAALTHLLILAGVIGLRRREDVTRAGRPATVGLGCVIAGTGLLFICEWLSIPLADRHTSATSVSVLVGVFGVASLLVTFGMIAAGVAIRRDGGGASWRRNAPLTCGLLSLVVIPVQFTSAIWLGVAVYGVGYGVLGTSLLTAPVPRADATLAADPTLPAT